jgi:hypothetical protein
MWRELSSVHAGPSSLSDHDLGSAKILGQIEPSIADTISEISQQVETKAKPLK